MSYIDIYNDTPTQGGSIYDALDAYTPSSSGPLPGPLAPNLPTAARSLQRTYARDLPEIRAKYPRAIVNALIDFESERAARGVPPLSIKKRRAILQSAYKRKAVTKPSEGNPLDFFGNIADDVGSIVQSIPQLFNPETWINEVEGLEKIPKILAKGDLAKLLQAPGIRLIPGTWTASNLIEGDFNELLTHPVMTGLDVLPYAKGLHVGQALGKTAIGESAKAAAAKAVGAASRTTVGTAVRETWSPAVRKVAKAAYDFAAEAHQRGVPGLRRFFPDELSGLSQDTVQWRQRWEHDVPDQARRSEIYDTLVTDSSKLDDLNLTDAELARVNEFRDLNHRYQQLGLDNEEIFARTIGGQEEVLSPVQTRRYDRLEGRRARRRALTDLNESINAPHTRPIEDVVQSAKAGLAATTNSAQRRTLARGLVHALDANGYDTGPLYQLSGKLTSPQVEGFLEEIDNTLSRGRTAQERVTARREAELAQQAEQRTAAVERRNIREETKKAQAAEPSVADLATAERDAARKLREAQREHESLQRRLADSEGVRSLESERAEWRASYDRYRDAVDEHRVAADALADARRARQGRRPLGETPRVPEYREPSATLEDELTKGRRKDRDAWTVQHRSFTRKALTRDEQRINDIQARIVPARWQPTVAANYQKRVLGAIRERLPEDDPRALMAADSDFNSAVGQLVDDGILDPAELRRWRGEAAASWQRMRLRGRDPEYVKKVSTQAAETVKKGRVRVSTIVPEPSQYRDRVWDWTPTSHDMGISIDAQRLELLRREASQHFVDWLDTSGLAETRAQVEARLGPVADRIAARSGRERGEVLEDLINKETVPLAAAKSEFLTGAQAKYTSSDYLNRDALFIGKPIAQSLRRMRTPSLFEQSLNPAIKVFRTAVLPFSPRWQVNNIFGNLIMATLEHPSSIIQLPESLRFANDIRRMGRALKAGKDYTLRESTMDLLERMKGTNVANELSSLEYSVEPAQRATKLHRYNGGRTLGKLGQEARTARLADGARRGINFVDKAADFSYAWNQMFDDMTRAMAYLSGEKQAMRSLVGKGLGESEIRAEAARRGEALVNKIAPRWSEMTPMERSVLRPLLPFYSFMSHVFRYAYRYPVDHPFRVSVMAALARAEMDDLGTGLPQMFARMMFIGSPDARGNQGAIDIGAANPFRDLGDNLTIAGFLSQTNPIFKVALHQLGYNPINKGPELYPQLEYDPETGGMRVRRQSTPGLLGELATSIVPQVQLLAQLAGTDSAFKDMMRRNPEAATRMLLSQAGVPLLYRNVNLPQQAFKAELARQEDTRTTLSQAIKTGDYGRASRYPGARQYINQLRTLRARGGLRPYQPGTLRALETATLP